VLRCKSDDTCPSPSLPPPQTPPLTSIYSPLAALTISSKEAFSRSVPLIISFVTVTYLAWCFPWWMSRVLLEMRGSRAVSASRNWGEREGGEVERE